MACPGRRALARASARPIPREPEPGLRGGFKAPLQGLIQAAEMNISCLSPGQSHLPTDLGVAVIQLIHLPLLSSDLLVWLQLAEKNT